MSATKDHAAQCKRDLHDAIRTLHELSDLRAELDRERMKMGSEVTQADIDGVDKKIEAQRSVIAERSKELETAAAAVVAEKRIEAEMHQELNKDNDPKIGMKPGENLDNFGKNKDDLEL